MSRTLYHKGQQVVFYCRCYINRKGQAVHSEELFLNTVAQRWYTYTAFKRVLKLQHYWMEEVDHAMIYEVPGHEDYWVTALMNEFNIQ